jgi:CRP-like cAMP-binding protein
MVNINRLQEYPIFSDLSEAELADLAARLVKRSFARNAYLYYPGTPGLNMYLVESGLVRQFFCDNTGREFMLNLIGPRSTISLPLLREDQVRATGAAAHQPAVVLCLSREDLFYFMERSPQFMRNVYADLTNSLLKLMVHTRSLASASLLERLAAILLYLWRVGQGSRSGVGTDDKITLPLSQSEIAGWLGASRGRLNRALSQLEQLGILRVNGQQLQILDRSRLEQMAEGLTPLQL